MLKVTAITFKEHFISLRAVRYPSSTRCHAMCYVQHARFSQGFIRFDRKVSVCRHDMGCEMRKIHSK